MENPTHNFREMYLVLQLIQEFRNKIETVISWSSRRKKKVHFLTFILSKGNFLALGIYLYV